MKEKAMFLISFRVSCKVNERNDLHEFWGLGPRSILVLNFSLDRQKGVIFLGSLQKLKERGEEGVGGSVVAILDFLGQLEIYLLPMFVKFLDLGEEAGSI